MPATLTINIGSEHIERVYCPNLRNSFLLYLRHSAAIFAIKRTTAPSHLLLHFPNGHCRIGYIQCTRCDDTLRAFCHATGHELGNIFNPSDNRTFISRRAYEIVVRYTDLDVPMFVFTEQPDDSGIAESIRRYASRASLRAYAQRAYGESGAILGSAGPMSLLRSTSSPDMSRYAWRVTSAGASGQLTASPQADRSRER